jgi:hypothetical protein
MCGVYDFALQDADFCDVDFEACTGPGDEVNDFLREETLFGCKLVYLGIGSRDFGWEVLGFGVGGWG